MIISARLTGAQRAYLDSVRAMAALFVLFGHASLFYLHDGFLPKLHIQTIGVMIFFLISGFLISLSVFQKHADRNYGFGEYFIDRFSRIYCAYFPALILVALADWPIRNTPFYNGQNNLAVEGHFTVQAWIANLFMLQDFPLLQVARRLGVPENAWFSHPFGSAGSLWTISIEWWIYMLFGTLVYFFLRGRKPSHPWQWAIVGFVAIEPVYHFIDGPDHCLTMLWVIGMGASFLSLRLPILAGNWPLTAGRWRHICLATSAAFLMAMIVHIYANHYHQPNEDVAELQIGVFLAVALFSLFFAFGTVQNMPGFLEKIFGFLANYSYSLYLTHLTVLWFIKIRFGGTDNDPRFFWFAIAVANLTALVFWWLFERHHRAMAAWLKAWINTRRQPVVVTQPSWIPPQG